MGRKNRRGKKSAISPEAENRQRTSEGNGASSSTRADPAGWPHYKLPSLEHIYRTQFAATDVSTESDYTKERQEIVDKFVEFGECVLKLEKTLHEFVLTCPPQMKHGETALRCAEKAERIGELAKESLELHDKVSKFEVDEAFLKVVKKRIKLKMNNIIDLITLQVKYLDALRCQFCLLESPFEEFEKRLLLCKLEGPDLEEKSAFRYQNDPLLNLNNEAIHFRIANKKDGETQKDVEKQMDRFIKRITKVSGLRNKLQNLSGKPPNKISFVFHKNEFSYSVNDTPGSLFKINPSETIDRDALFLFSALTTYKEQVFLKTFN